MKKYIKIEEYLETQSLTKANKNNKITILFCIISILCLTVIIFSLYNIFNWFQDNSKIRKIKSKIDDDINLNKIIGEGEIVNPTDNLNSNYWYYVRFPFYEVNFSILSSKNSDTIAFIHIRNTNVNYPVVQSTNNDYYLSHSFNKEKNNAGWIFMDYRNNIDYLSDNTIIYGHARLDKTLFGSLKNTLSKNWQKNKDNYVIWLSTPKENMLFQIFSIYTIQSEKYYITTDFIDDSSKKLWLSTMKERNIAPIDTPVDTNDKILTLSTCQNNHGGRIVIHARLIKKQIRK